MSVKLFPFQEEDVGVLSKMKTCFLASEMGVGKSLEAITWAAFEPGVRVVVCPACMKYVWVDEINRARPKDKVWVVDSKAGVSWAHWVIVNYDILARNLGALKELDAVTVILDESHMVKSRSAQRTKAALTLGLGVPRKICVTGTPILNRPMELFTQLVFLGKKRMGDWFAFGLRYADGQQKFVSRKVGYVWDFSGASNLTELNAFLKPFMVRRTKAEVLKDLPPMRYRDQVVDLDPATRKSYKKAEEDFVGWLIEQGRGLKSAQALAKLNVLRQLALQGKRSALIELLGDYKEARKKIVVFCGFLVEGLDPLKEAFPESDWVSLTGQDDARDRNESVKRFQSDPNIIFAFCSTLAAGVGITLTAADTALFYDLPWSPGIKAQAEARIHRIGQTGSAQVIHFLGAGTIDLAMAGVLAKKREVIGQVVDGVAPMDAEVINAVMMDLVTKKRRK